MPIIIDEIKKYHNRKAFDCGVEALNQYLQRQARQKTAKNIAKTYVVSESDRPEIILGYYTVAGYSVIMPFTQIRQYKNYPHPLNAVKLARIAVDSAYQGQHLGEQLLVDAIYRTVRVAEQIAAIGLFVDPKTPSIVPFYAQYGFLSVESQQKTQLEMWLPISTCREVINTL